MTANPKRLSAAECLCHLQPNRRLFTRHAWMFLSFLFFFLVSIFLLQDTIQSLASQVDEKTKTADHAGVVTMASNVFSQATSYLPTSITTHLPSALQPSATTTAGGLQQPATVGEATGNVIHDVAQHSAVDDDEVKQALRELAGKAEQSLEGAREGVDAQLARP